MSKLVSVIIPAYNVENYIEDAINSVRNQTYTHWELLIVDDGSTDGTKRKIMEIAAHDSRLRLIIQVNGGSSHARNTGLDNAIGNCIAFLDGDDMWQPTFLEELLAVKEKAGLAMAYCGYTHLYKFGIKRGFHHQYVDGDALTASIKGLCPIHIGCTLADKDFYDTHNLRFTVGCLIGQDSEFILKVLAFTKVISLHKELMLYRIHNSSAVHSQWKWQKQIHAIYGARRARTIILQERYDKIDNSQIASAFKQRIAVQWLRLIWRMIKNGNYNEALELLDNPVYAQEIRLLNYHEISQVNAIKFKIVQSRNLNLWKKIKIFSYI